MGLLTLSTDNVITGPEAETPLARLFSSFSSQSGSITIPTNDAVKFRALILAAESPPPYRIVTTPNALFIGVHSVVPLLRQEIEREQQERHLTTGKCLFSSPSQFATATAPSHPPLSSFSSLRNSGSSDDFSSARGHSSRASWVMDERGLLRRRPSHFGGGDDDDASARHARCLTKREVVADGRRIRRLLRSAFERGELAVCWPEVWKGRWRLKGESERDVEALHTFLSERVQSLETDALLGRGEGEKRDNDAFIPRGSSARERRAGAGGGMVRGWWQKRRGLEEDGSIYLRRPGKRGAAATAAAVGAHYHHHRKKGEAAVQGEGGEEEARGSAGGQQSILMSSSSAAAAAAAVVAAPSTALNSLPKPISQTAALPSLTRNQQLKLDQIRRYHQNRFGGPPTVTVPSFPHLRAKLLRHVVIPPVNKSSSHDDNNNNNVNNNNNKSAVSSFFPSSFDRSRNFRLHSRTTYRPRFSSPSTTTTRMAATTTTALSALPDDPSSLPRLPYPQGAASYSRALAGGARRAAAAAPPPPSRGKVGGCSPLRPSLHLSSSAPISPSFPLHSTTRAASPSSSSSSNVGVAQSISSSPSFSSSSSSSSSSSLSSSSLSSSSSSTTLSQLSTRDVSSSLPHHRAESLSLVKRVERTTCFAHPKARARHHNSSLPTALLKLRPPPPPPSLPSHSQLTPSPPFGFHNSSIAKPHPVGGGVRDVSIPPPFFDAAAAAAGSGNDRKAAASPTSSISGASSDDVGGKMMEGRQQTR